MCNNKNRPLPVGRLQSTANGVTANQNRNTDTVLLALQNVNPSPVGLNCAEKCDTDSICGHIILEITVQLTRRAVKVSDRDRNPQQHKTQLAMFKSALIYTSDHGYKPTRPAFIPLWHQLILRQTQSLFVLHINMKTAIAFFFFFFFGISFFFFFPVDIWEAGWTCNGFLQ